MVYTMIQSIMKKCSWMNTDSGLFVLRIGVGVIFLMAGWQKVAHLEATVAMFGTMGIGVFWTYVASFGELIGGILVLTGLHTRIGAFLITVTMIVATWMTRSNPMMIMLPAAMLFAGISLWLSGGGRYSLSRIIWKSKCACGTCATCTDKPSIPTHS